MSRNQMVVDRPVTRDSKLSELHDQFLSTSSQSMPLAGIVFWSVVALAAPFYSPQQVAYLVGFGSGTIFPLALLIDRLRGRTPVATADDNPLLGMFLQSLVVVGLLWPFVIIAAVVSRTPELVTLGGAILMGIVWIPYGWAAGDPVGLRHAVARCILSYAAFVLVPPASRTTVIALVVLVCYGYSLLAMRRA